MGLHSYWHRDRDIEEAAGSVNDESEGREI
jgi:hypothetical protein